jgi:hypothetical protein
VQYAVDYAIDKRVDLVIVAGKWSSDFQLAAQEIRKLKSASIDVILVGPPLGFTEDVYKFIARRNQDETQKDLVIKFRRNENFENNKNMTDFARSNGVRYLDRIRIFCNNFPNCPLVTEDGEILVFDAGGHLSSAGSKYLGERIRKSGFLSGDGGSSVVSGGEPSSIDGIVFSDSVQSEDLIGVWVAGPGRGIFERLPDGSIRTTNDRGDVSSVDIHGGIFDCKEWGASGRLSLDKTTLVWSNGSTWQRHPWLNWWSVHILQIGLRNDSLHQTIQTSPPPELNSHELSDA